MSEFCDPKHLYFAIALLFGVIIAMSAGQGLGKLGLFLLKKLLGKETVVVKVNSEDRTGMAEDREAMASDRLAMAGDRALLAGHACLIPENCPKHGEESARSLQNKSDIAKLEGMINTNRELFWKELKAARKGITCIINGLLAKQIIDPHDLPKED